MMKGNATFNRVLDFKVPSGNWHSVYITQKPDKNGGVWQAWIVMPGEEVSPPSHGGHFHDDPAHVLAETIPWYTIGRWDDPKVYDQSLYDRAKKIVRAKRLRQQQEKQAKAARREANELAERKRLSGFQKLVDAAYGQVSIKRGEIPLSVYDDDTPAKKNPEFKTEVVDGWLVIKDGQETGLGVHRSRKNKSAWCVTHIPTGLLVGLTSIRTRTNAVKWAALLVSIFQEWNEIKTLADIPDGLGEKAQAMMRDFVRVVH